MARYYADSKIGYPQYRDTIGRLIKYDGTFTIQSIESYKFTNSIRDAERAFSLERLPNELLLHIMEHADVLTLAQLRMVNRKYCELMKSYREVWRSAIYNTIGSDAVVHVSRRLQNVGLVMALKERNWTMGCCIIHNLSKISPYVCTGIASQGNWVILYTEDGLISHMDLPNLRMRPVGLYKKGIRTVQCRSDGAMIAASLNGDILLYSSTGFLGHIRTNSPCINATLTSSYIYGLCDDGNIVQFDRVTRNQVASYYIAGVRVYYDIAAFGNDAVVSTSEMLLLVKGSEQKVITIPHAPGRLPSKARLLDAYDRTKLIAYRRGGFSVFRSDFTEEVEIINNDLCGGPLCVVDKFLILTSYGMIFVYNINDYRLVTHYEFLPSDAYITGIAGSDCRIVVAFERSEARKYDHEEQIKVIDLEVVLRTE